MKIRSMKGREVNMSEFMAKNEGAIAVGNANMNARGDILGKGGKILKTRDDIAQEYHQANPKAVRHVPLRDLEGETIQPLGSDALDVEFTDPAEAVASIDAQMKIKRQRKIEDND